MISTSDSPGGIHLQHGVGMGYAYLDRTAALSQICMAGNLQFPYSLVLHPPKPVDASTRSWQNTPNQPPPSPQQYSPPPTQPSPPPSNPSSENPYYRPANTLRAQPSNAHKRNYHTQALQPHNIRRGLPRMRAHQCS
jgi:hypothetical protein